MALDMKNLKALALAAVNANPSAPVAYSFGEEKFSYDEVQEAFRNEMRELAGTPQQYRENKNTIFALMEEIIDEVLPKKVLAQYGQFAEIKTVPQGDQPVFKTRITEASRQRAKQFVTKVGLAGVYETFKLEGSSIEVPVTAYGGAARIELEEFLDGRVDMADVLDIVLEGLDESVYKEIAKALQGCASVLPTDNKVSAGSFDEGKMDDLLSIADSYGRATIYCTLKFAATMVPAAGWESESMKNEKWSKGYLANFHGHQVVVLDQSYDYDPVAKTYTPIMDDQVAYVIPTGTDAGKPIKVVFEGQSQVKDIDNYDWSREIQTYTKFGVAAITSNALCMYTNTGL